jgi:hypothetical protein
MEVRKQEMDAARKTTGCTPAGTKLTMHIFVVLEEENS